MPDEEPYRSYDVSDSLYAFDDIRKRLDGSISEMIKKYQIACNQLTEKQLAEAIKQAILAGDFTQCILVQNHSQAVVYHPYQGVEELRSENLRLKEKLSALTAILNDDTLPNA